MCDANVQTMIDSARVNHAMLRNDRVAAAVDMLHREGMAIDRGDLRSAADYRRAYEAICALLGMAPIRRMV